QQASCEESHGSVSPAVFSPVCAAKVARALVWFQVSANSSSNLILHSASHSWALAGAARSRRNMEKSAVLICAACSVIAGPSAFPKWCQGDRRLLLLSRL